jgi:hypothetical protein
MTGDKLYIWKKTEPETVEATEQNDGEKYSSIVLPNLSASKLKDMNWELDVKRKDGVVNKEKIV